MSPWQLLVWTRNSSKNYKVACHNTARIQWNGTYFGLAHLFRPLFAGQWKDHRWQEIIWYHITSEPWCQAMVRAVTRYHKKRTTIPSDKPLLTSIHHPHLKFCESRGQCMQLSKSQTKNSRILYNTFRSRPGKLTCQMKRVKICIHGAHPILKPHLVMANPATVDALLKLPIVNDMTTDVPIHQMLHVLNNKMDSLKTTQARLQDTITAWHHHHDTPTLWEHFARFWCITTTTMEYHLLGNKIKGLWPLWEKI